MAPPPITPSPHRFLTSKSKPANTTPKPSSSLRFQQNATQSPSSQQFASAPRFNFSSTQKTANENATPATQLSSPLSRRLHLPPAFPVKNREDIEETSSDREDDELLQDNGASHFAIPTQPTSKRRRPNPPEAEAEAEAEAIIISSDSPSPTSPPTTPLHPTIEEDDPSDPVPAPQFQTSTTSTTHQPPRFVLPLPKPTSDTTTPSIPSRPPLILPPRSPFPPPAALPAIFSPQRRGQKYVPGGLAATVRDWIVETGQVAHNQAHGRRGTEGEVWDVKIRVGECVVSDEGAGMVLVRVRDGGRWMLAGRGRGESEVGLGMVVGLREPVWEVEVGEEGERERWSVGVESRVLDG